MVEKSNLVEKSDLGEKFSSAIEKLWKSYQKETAQNLKLIDAYLVFILFSGIFQFTYCVIVGTFPYNAFLSGFISCVGSFVLAAFADFVFSNILLHFFVVNFIG
ncbi:19324_t:CDS:2 [Rhizophagus irregularis]|nr:19319_t:CDS:2 [Rhizophagus irregularis]CAG8526628.1 19324_t:CDS:2 [Rhizophagus irregularis]